MIRSFFESNAFLKQRNRDLQIELCCLCKVSAMFLKMASSLEIQIANEFLNPGFGNAEIMDFGRLSDLEPVCFGARTMPSKKHAHFRGIWKIPATAATLPVPSLKLTACPWKCFPKGNEVQQYLPTINVLRARTLTFQGSVYSFPFPPPLSFRRMGWLISSSRAPVSPPSFAGAGDSATKVVLRWASCRVTQQRKRKPKTHIWICLQAKN